jgi:hypothetical protein
LINAASRSAHGEWRGAFLSVDTKPGQKEATPDWLSCGLWQAAVFNRAILYAPVRTTPTLNPAPAPGAFDQVCQNAWLCGVPERQRKCVRQQPLVKLLRSPGGEYLPD